MSILYSAHWFTGAVCSLTSFASVENLYNEAPNLKRWKITKFRPRREILNQIKYKGISLSPDEVAFELIPNNNKIDITLYIMNYNEIDKNIYAAIGFLFLDTNLGEYDVETKVGKVDIKSSEDILNFSDNNIKYLSKKFDEVYKKVNV